MADSARGYAVTYFTLPSPPDAWIVTRRPVADLTEALSDGAYVGTWLRAQRPTVWEVSPWVKVPVVEMVATVSLTDTLFHETSAPKSRFFAVEHEVCERISSSACVAIPLREARRRSEQWSRDALELQRRGDHRRARVYAIDARDLSLAASAAAAWLVCAGHRDPFAEDGRAA